MERTKENFFKILKYFGLFLIGAFGGRIFGETSVVIGGFGFPLSYYIYSKYLTQDAKEKRKERKKQEEFNKKAQSPETQQLVINNIKKDIKLVDVSQIDDIISKNEKKIMDYDKSKLHDLIRLSRFIKDVELKIDEKYKFEMSGESIGSSELTALLFLADGTKDLDLMVKLNITMINSLVNDKITDFLTIYEKFEKIGAFRNSTENELLFKLDKIENNLNSISNQLKKIDSKLGYQNLVLTYNTYQFHKIRKS